VHRNADGACLVGDRARDRLPDPPRRVGREFVAAAVFELVDRLHEADVAFLDEVEELQTAIGVFFRDRDHQAQVRLGHLALGLARLGLARGHLLVDLLQVLQGDHHPFLQVEELLLLLDDRLPVLGQRLAERMVRGNLAVDPAQ